MSLFSKLFSGSGGGAGEPEHIDYKGFTITPEPMKDGGKYRIAARVEKVVAGESKTHTLIRADVMDSRDDAVEASTRKAKQVIDEQGDSLFD